MVEEMNNPQVQAPIAMILAVAIGASSSLIVLIVFLFTLTDLDEVISSSAGAILTILDQATKNRAAAVSLLMFPVVSMCFAAISILTAASRQTQALARDRGLPFWKVWEKQNPTLGVPVYSISLTTFFGACLLSDIGRVACKLTFALAVIIFGCIVRVLVIIEMNHILTCFYSTSDRPLRSTPSFPPPSLTSKCRTASLC